MSGHPFGELLAYLRVLELPTASSADVLQVTAVSGLDLFVLHSHKISWKWWFTIVGHTLLQYCEVFKNRPEACDAAVFILSNHCPG
jgi:hypothetical protein